MSLDTHLNPSFESDAAEFSRDGALPTAGNRQPRRAARESVSSVPTVSSEQWERLKRKIIDRSRKHAAHALFGNAAKQGQVYRWGFACARGGAVDDTTLWLSHLACDREPSKKLSQRVDVQRAIGDLMDATPAFACTPIHAATAVVWAAAMPALIPRLDQPLWWELLSTLQQLRESILERNQVDAPLHLLIAGELGLTLGWRLADLPSCKRLNTSSAKAVEQWCKCDEDAVAMAVKGAVDARLVMASLIRSRQLINENKKGSSKDRTQSVGENLATWVTALTTCGGGSGLSEANRQDVVDDLADEGLLDKVIAYDRPTLRPAMKAALGKSRSGGRLAWQVSLPESMHLCEGAKLAVLMPEWDVRRGRTHLDFSGDDVWLEIFGGRETMLAGRWQTSIQVDQQEQHARGAWELTCEYTDDDVHYFELEQTWSGGLMLQRQVMMIRDDRCLLLADGVITSDEDREQASEIRYLSRLPMAAGVSQNEESETREVFLSQGRNRAMLIPLAANEWRSGLSRASLQPTPDDHLALVARGRGCLYAPLWIDFQQRRFNRKRTWRQLTIADERQIVGSNEAVGYRIQVGSEQWLLYRSLIGNRCRTVLGKHMLADFFCGRFDSGDGSIEDLVTVDNRELENG